MFKFRDNGQVIVSDPVSLLAVAPTTIAIPEGRQFVVDEVGLIVTTLTGAIVLQPTVSFGFSGSDAALLAPLLATQLTLLGKRERMPTLLLNDALTTLTASVTIAATGPSVYRARFYFRGFLL
jgi:hypothetical protein